MKTAVADNGEIVIPREIAEAAGLAPGMDLELTAERGAVRAEPAYMEVRFEREGPFLFPVPVTPGPVLDERIVDETRAAILAERLSRLVGDA